MNGIDLRQLRYFQAVAEQLHSGRPAEMLEMPQPPLSQQIRRLELRMGVELFHRTKRRVELSEPGRILLQHARSTLAQAQRAVDETRLAARGELGKLAVGLVSSAMYEDLVPKTLQTFVRRYPSVDLILREASMS